MNYINTNKQSKLSSLASIILALLPKSSLRRYNTISEMCQLVEDLNTQPNIVASFLETNGEGSMREYDYISIWYLGENYILKNNYSFSTIDTVKKASEYILPSVIIKSSWFTLKSSRFILKSHKYRGKDRTKMILQPMANVGEEVIEEYKEYNDFAERQSAMYLAGLDDLHTSNLCIYNGELLVHDF